MADLGRATGYLTPRGVRYRQLDALDRSASSAPDPVVAQPMTADPIPEPVKPPSHIPEEALKTPSYGAKDFLSDVASIFRKADSAIPKSIFLPHFSMETMPNYEALVDLIGYELGQGTFTGGWDEKTRKVYDDAEAAGVSKIDTFLTRVATIPIRMGKDAWKEFKAVGENWQQLTQIAMDQGGQFTDDEKAEASAHLTTLAMGAMGGAPMTGKANTLNVSRNQALEMLYESYSRYKGPVAEALRGAKGPVAEKLGMLGSRLEKNYYTAATGVRNMVESALRSIRSIGMDDLDMGTRGVYDPLTKRVDYNPVVQLGYDTIAHEPAHSIFESRAFTRTGLLKKLRGSPQTYHGKESGKSYPLPPADYFKGVHEALAYTFGDKAGKILKEAVEGGPELSYPVLRKLIKETEDEVAGQWGTKFGDLDPDKVVKFYTERRLAKEMEEFMDSPDFMAGTSLSNREYAELFGEFADPYTRRATPSELLQSDVAVAKRALKK